MMKKVIWLVLIGMTAMVAACSNFRPFSGV
jgi:predicted small secreted protein